MKNDKLTAEYIKNVGRIMRIFNIGAINILVSANGKVKTFKLIKLSRFNSKNHKWNIEVVDAFGNKSYDRVFEDFKDLIEEFKNSEWYMAKMV